MQISLSVSAGGWERREVEEGKLQVQESKEGASVAKQMSPGEGMGVAAGTRECPATFFSFQ